MVDFGLNIFGNLGGYLTTFKNVMIIVLITLVIGTFLTIWLWRKMQGKKYNIPLIIVTPRSDGRVVEINNGVGGFFKSKKVGGITSFRIKRKGIGVVDIPPPPSSYLSSPQRTLFLAQKGVDDYEPILPDQLSFVNTEDGQISVPILKLKAINQSATAWAFDNEETAKKRFTFMSLWDKYQTLISMMIFIFILFLILYINWIGLKEVVASLKDLIVTIKGGGIDGGTAPIITPSG